MQEKYGRFYNILSGDSKNYQLLSAWSIGFIDISCFRRYLTGFASFEKPYL